MGYKGGLMVALNTERCRIARKRGGKYPKIIVEMFEAGISKQEIADIFILKVHSVEYHLRSKADGYVYKAKRNPLTENEIIDIHNSDDKDHVIKEKFKISLRTIEDIKAHRSVYGDVLRKHCVERKSAKKVDDPGLDVIGERPCLGLGCDAMIPRIRDRHRQQHFCNSCYESNRGRTQDDILDPQINNLKIRGALCCQK